MSEGVEERSSLRVQIRRVTVELQELQRAHDEALAALKESNDEARHLRNSIGKLGADMEVSKVDIM